MQVNQSGSPFQLRLDPSSFKPTGPTADQIARRQLTASAAEKVFTDTQRQLVEGRRVDTLQKSRAPIYRQVQHDLQDVAAQLGALQQAITGALGATAPGSVTSPEPLSLGRRVGEPAPALEPRLDPTALLSSQRFATPISAGDLQLSFEVNGGPATSASIAIDPATQSLDDVTSALSNLAVGGGSPLRASFDASAQQLRLDVASSGGSRFEFSIAGGNGTFNTAIAEGGFQATTAVQAQAAIADSPSATGYNQLTVTLDGAGSKTFTNLAVSSASLAADQKVDELVGQLNAGLGGLGLAAVNAGGKLGFTRTVDDPAAAPFLGISVSEASTPGGLALGFQGGLNGQATLRLDPNLLPETPATATQPAPALGPDASLRDLAGQLGLTANRGRFELEANGQKLIFSQDQSVDDVIAGLNATGLSATYNSASRTITVVDPDGGPVTISDKTGNLAAALGIDAGAATRNNAALGQSLRDLADSLDRITGLVESVSRPGTGLDNDRLLADLQASLSGLFATTAHGPLSGLGDLGITRGESGLQIDATKLQGLLSERRGDVEGFLGTFIGEKVAPLLRAGAKAVASSEEVAPAESEAAARSVRVRGEIARLQVRQQMLALESQSFENFQESLERQHAELEKAADDLAQRTPTGMQEDAEQAAREAALLGRDRSGFTTPPSVVGPATTATAAPAFGSFGLSNASTA